jgi:hypothetical protein
MSLHRLFLLARQLRAFLRLDAERLELRCSHNRNGRKRISGREEFIRLPAPAVGQVSAVHPMRLLR